jgi:hypothetical protein
MRQRQHAARGGSYDKGSERRRPCVSGGAARWREPRRVGLIGCATRRGVTRGNSPVGREEMLFRPAGLVSGDLSRGRTS